MLQFDGHSAKHVPAFDFLQRHATRAGRQASQLFVLDSNAHETMQSSFAHCHGRSDVWNQSHARWLETQCRQVGQIVRRRTRCPVDSSPRCRRCGQIFALRSEQRPQRSRLSRMVGQNDGSVQIDARNAQTRQRR